MVYPPSHSLIRHPIEPVCAHSGSVLIPGRPGSSRSYPDEFTSLVREFRTFPGFVSDSGPKNSLKFTLICKNKPNLRNDCQKDPSISGGVIYSDEGRITARKVWGYQKPVDLQVSRPVLDQVRTTPFRERLPVESCRPARVLQVTGPAPGKTATRTRANKSRARGRSRAMTR